ncbi:MAG: metallophosphoesterase [Desulfobacterales bacterium]|nr:metallophosphoesterase [Desulfobacterales bacterium]
MDSICIYAAADLHGRPDRFDLVARQAARPDIGLVVLAGDLVHYARGHAGLERLMTLPKPLLAVRGNTDPRRIAKLSPAGRGIDFLDLERRRFDGLTIVGIGGTLPIPFRSRLGWSEHRRLECLAGLVDNRTIIVAHPPPYGVRDRVAGRWHAGSRGLRRWVEQIAPAVLICGHIHEAAGVGWIGPTLVVNCALGKKGRGAIIRYDRDGKPRARMI